MIISWMLSSLVFTAYLAVGAAAVESVALPFGRPTRWIWTTALATSALWPALTPWMLLAVPQLRDVAAVLPAIRVVADDAALLGGAGSATADAVGRALLGGWALATLWLAARLMNAVVASRRLRADAEPRLLDGVPVLLTDRLGPATIGIRQREVIVPRMLLELEEPLRRLVLRHEREHCAARDPWLLLGATVALVLFPWNAALWFIAHRLRLALEIDCDARVLASGADATRYGRLLLWTAQRRTTIPIAPMLAAPPSHLERRILAMRSRLVRPRPLRLGGAVALFVFAIAGACSQGVPDGPLQQETPPASSRIAAGPKSNDGPYFEFQVESQARSLPGTTFPAFPPAMRRAHREGEVLAQFVVDKAGVPDLATFRALKASDPAFTDAVRQALPSMRFSPARVGGAAVAQIVQQPFTFALSGR